MGIQALILSSSPVPFQDHIVHVTDLTHHREGVGQCHKTSSPAAALKSIYTAV